MLTLTESIARAIAQDAGNAHMRRHGRKVWNEDDYNTAVDRFSELIPHLPLEARLRLTGNSEGKFEE